MNSLPKNKTNAGIFRRLFAIFYDYFLLIALLMATTAIFNAVNHGIAIDSASQLYIPLVLTLAVISFFFFTWFWVNGGQTLGLKTWQCKVVDKHNNNISWRQATIRFFMALISAACFGLGFLWSLFHKDKKTWHDLVANTQLLDLRS